MSHRIERRHHVGIAVRDLAASVAWYCDHLGFRPRYDAALPGAAVCVIARGDAHLELREVDGAMPPSTERERADTMLKVEGVNHPALPVDDLAVTMARLAAAGVEIAMPPRLVADGSGDRFAFIRDNERTLIELFQRAA